MRLHGLRCSVGGRRANECCVESDVVCGCSTAVPSTATPSTAVPSTATPVLAPTPTLGTRFPSLEMRLDGSIDSWLPSDTIKLKRRVGAMLGVQNGDNMIVKARAGSIVVTLTILEGKSRAMCNC